jgi:biopolymer transport protein ExbB
MLTALRDREIATAEALADSLPSPVHELAVETVRHHDSPREHLEEILHEKMLSFTPRLERNLGALAVLGGIAPLLGLLGTVTGMIHTFQLVTIFGSGDAKLLSGGISEALVTTETGLAIAIPVLLVHAFLSRRARTLLGDIDTLATTLVHDLHLRKPMTLDQHVRRSSKSVDG